MRLYFIFSLLITSTFIHAADCHTSNNDIPGGGTFNCDNLYIDNVLQIGADPLPVIINVTGEVIISANIILNGGNGTNAPNVDTNGGDGGPGAGAGGGYIFFGNQSGQDADYPLSTSNGQKVTNNNFHCGHGGGGGGFRIEGNDGEECAPALGPTGAKGTSTVIAEFDFTLADFRGGFGGGAGDSGSAFEMGTGGGAGGALHINAGGDITIESGVTLFSKGGAGGDGLLSFDSDGAGGLSDGGGGGGGGGSGGVFWLKTTGLINNLGTIDVRGGAGGKNIFTGGDGGNGGDGVYFLESSSAPILGTGLRSPPAPTASSAVQTAYNLNSDISCGSIKINDNQNVAQMVLSFMLVFVIGRFFRRRRSL